MKTYEIGQQVEVRPSIAGSLFNGRWATVTKVFKNGNIEVAVGQAKQKVEAKDLRPYLTVEARNAEAVKAIDYALSRIDQRLAEPQAKLDGIRAKLADPSERLGYTIRWVAEDVFDAEAALKLYGELNVANMVEEVRSGKLSLQEMARELLKHEGELVARHLTSPYRTCSTSAIENLSDEREHYTRASMLSTRFGGSLAHEVAYWAAHAADIAAGTWSE